MHGKPQYFCFDIRAVSIMMMRITKSGAVLGGFLRFPETTQDFPSTMSAALFSATTFHEAYTAG